MTLTGTSTSATSPIQAEGVGALKQNVHGVVDLCGAQKASYDVLRRESSPVESLTVENRLNTFKLRLQTRHDVPAFTLRGYKLRGTFYGPGDLPVERHEVELPEIAAGNEATVDLIFSQSGVPVRVKFDILRPIGFSVFRPFRQASKASHSKSQMSSANEISNED